MTTMLRLLPTAARSPRTALTHPRSARGGTVCRGLILPTPVTMIGEALAPIDRAEAHQ